MFIPLPALAGEGGETRRVEPGEGQCHAPHPTSQVLGRPLPHKRGEVKQELRQRRLYPVGRERQTTDAYAGGIEDRVGDRRGNRTD